MSNDIVTTDLSDFGARELHMASDLLKAIANGYPEGFSEEGVQIAFNRNSGYVFLTNSDFEVAMAVDGELEKYYSTPSNGIEGFFSDLVFEYPNMDAEDRDYVRDISNEQEASEINRLLDQIVENATKLEEDDIDYLIKYSTAELSTDHVVTSETGLYSGTLLKQDDDFLYILRNGQVIESEIDDVQLPEHLDFGDKVRIKIEEGHLQSITVFPRSMNNDIGH